MEKYEQKEAWVLDEANANMHHGTLLLKDDKPFAIIENDDAYKIKKHYRIYYSEKEANEAYEEYKLDIKELCKEVKDNIEKLEKLSFNVAKREDYIPEYILGDRNSYKRYYYLYERIISYIRYGIININALSFTKESVSHVNWGEGCAEICLKNGQKVKTYNETENDLIEDVFGMNASERYFTDMKPEEEEGDD